MKKQHKALLGAAALAAAALVAIPLTTSTDTTPPPPPVVLMHGYGDGTCAGYDVNGDQWNDALAFLPAQGLTDLITVAYYACDTNATVNIAQGSYNQNTPLGVIAHDLAWWAYNTYGEQPITFIGHSLGGILIREALRRIAAHDPTYPPALTVPTVVTVSSPMGGWAKPLCNTVECNEVHATSSFITALQSDPAPQPGPIVTRWAALAGGLCDPIPAKSAQAINGDRYDYTSPCYSHIKYVHDQMLTLNAGINFTAVDSTTVMKRSSQPHALLLIANILDGAS